MTLEDWFDITGGRESSVRLKGPTLEERPYPIDYYTLASVRAARAGTAWCISCRRFHVGGTQAEVHSLA